LTNKKGRVAQPAASATLKAKRATRLAYARKIYDLSELNDDMPSARIGQKWTTVQTRKLKAGHFSRDAKATRHPQRRVLRMRTWTFPAVIEKLRDDDFLATFPDVPEARTGGASLAEVRENTAYALEEAILAYLAHMSGRSPRLASRAAARKRSTSTP
jgi:predicted RNase H-like HicB family nuclease